VLELRPSVARAVARPGRYPSAVCHRDAAVSVLAVGIGVPPFVDAVRKAGEAVERALAPWSDGAVLPNFSTGPAAYDAPTLARLLAVAAHYDPAHVLADGTRRLGRQ
jgi:hypothetical protein